MKYQAISQKGIIRETLSGIVNRVTYHNPENGWTVLRVTPFDNQMQQETVVVYQTKVFAGATMEFRGNWTSHPQFGRQFKADVAIEKKPATTAALEKYLGSGLIKGVGPKTAQRIVRHFGKQTLDVFEGEIDRLTEVPGIAHKKLEIIRLAWSEHRAIRKVMMFLQSHGISTLFAVKIYKQYGDNAINNVMADPYRLSYDFYGIGFFSADKVALSIGLAKDSDKRIMAGIRHVLAASRDFGHCYLTYLQIETQVKDLLELDVRRRLPELLDSMEAEHLVMVRRLTNDSGESDVCYYSKSLYFDEKYVADRINSFVHSLSIDRQRIEKWVDNYCCKQNISLSAKQAAAVKKIPEQKISILTGGPGTGKTTTTLVLVKLLQAMELEVVLAAPTGRAAQRMAEVIGLEAKTIHRLLEWQGGKFKKNEETPLEADFLIVDECSMLDITLTASLFKALSKKCQVLLIGDADQLPSVGAGNVLRDIISSDKICCFSLTEIFRQAQESLIVKYAHQINRGDLPHIDSPFYKPDIWRQNNDCIFLDADEATKEQLLFVSRVKRFYVEDETVVGEVESSQEQLYEFRTNEAFVPYETEVVIPKKFQHVDLAKVHKARTSSEELMAVLKKVHPWSALRYGLSASDIVRKLYLEWIPKYKSPAEIQILSPMTRGSLGTFALNKMIQQAANPAAPGRGQLQVGERIFRLGDRVIHKRNNYDLAVFNGDIGVICAVNAEELTCVVSFFPDNREVQYQRDDIVELDLAYAITIHKSQGSEFESVIIPVLSQHFKMLFRNLIYTGLTRAKKLAVIVGSRRALAMAVKNRDTALRQTALQKLLSS